MKLQLIFIILFCVSTASNVYAENSPADAYYEQNLAAGNTPADSYYHNNLRWGTDPEDPDGEGDGKDTPVGGLPLGEVSIPGILLMGATALFYRHKRTNRFK